MERERVIGIVSDTHGLLRQSVKDALRAADFIVHAGDVGAEEVLDELRTLAPVTAVRGNTDIFGWAQSLPLRELVHIDDVALYVLHDVELLDLDPVVANVAVVISGHTHKPSISRQHGVLYLNPGSAGPRRFNYPISIALLKISGGQLTEQVIHLD